MSLPQTDNKYIESIQKVFEGNNETEILAKIKEFKKSGSIAFLELLLKLLDETKIDVVKRAALTIISNLQLQKFTPTIIKFVENMDEPDYAAEFIAACWESHLDFSDDLQPFAKTFIHGNFQTTLESFTVIEEAMWQANETAINNCRSYLIDRIDELSPEKKELFNELIHVLESGKTHNSEDHPELYPEK